MRSFTVTALLFCCVPRCEENQGVRERMLSLFTQLGNLNNEAWIVQPQTQHDLKDLSHLQKYLQTGGSLKAEGQTLDHTSTVVFRRLVHDIHWQAQAKDPETVHFQARSRFTAPRSEHSAGSCRRSGGHQY